MSEPRDNDDSEQEIPELSDGEEIDEETEDDDFRSLIEDPGSHLQADCPGFASSPRGAGMLQQITPPGDEIPLDSQRGAVVPEDQMGNHSDPDGEPDVEVKQERDSGNVELYNGRRLLDTDVKVVHTEDNQLAVITLQPERTGGESPATMEASNQSHAFSPNFLEGDDSGSDDEISAFMKELERFHKEKSLEFKPPKFYGIGLNCLKLWRAVTRLGGYEQVTSCKLWRQVGESFRPPKTCTTVSWTFRIFYEKALLEYEKHKILTGELHIPISSIPETLIVEKKIGGNQTSGSGRARRDAAARAMQGWHSQRLLGNGEVGDPIIKDKNSGSLLRRDKYLKGSLKRKKASSLEHAAKFARSKFVKPQGDSMVVDIGEPADWVKINVRPTKDCFEVYALVPGLLREEVHVQSDPGGRLIISGEPEQHDNPWGVTPFKKVITLPSRIDPHQTSAVVTLHGQLFVRAPFEQSDI